jgi:hypothetical protein
MAKQEDQQTYILQSVTLGGEEFDLSLITHCAYIETFDLSGPKLILKFHDRYAFLRDQLGLKEFDEIEVTLADPFHQDGIDEKQKFIILTMPIKEGVMTLNAMQSDIFRGKKQCPADGGMSFMEKPLDTDVITEIFPGVDVEKNKSVFRYRKDTSREYTYWDKRKLAGKNKRKIDFPTVSGYYLSPTDKTLNTPCKLMRHIAAEYGFVCFWKRNLFYCMKLSDMLQEERFYYDYDDPTMPNQIHDYKQLNIAAMVKGKTMFNYRGFDITRGRIKGGVETDSTGNPLPIRFSGATDEMVFDSLTQKAIPIIDIVTLGNGFIQPGKTAYLTWNVANKDAPIDESLPDRVIIGNVTHFYTPQRYYCRFRGIQWPEE